MLTDRYVPFAVQIMTALLVSCIVSIWLSTAAAVRVTRANYSDSAVNFDTVCVPSRCDVVGLNVALVGFGPSMSAEIVIADYVMRPSNNVTWLLSPGPIVESASSVLLTSHLSPVARATVGAAETVELLNSETDWDRFDIIIFFGGGESGFVPWWLANQSYMFERLRQFATGSSRLGARAVVVVGQAADLLSRAPLVGPLANARPCVALNTSPTPSVTQLFEAANCTAASNVTAGTASRVALANGRMLIVSTTIGDALDLLNVAVHADPTDPIASNFSCAATDVVRLAPTTVLPPWLAPLREADIWAIAALTDDETLSNATAINASVAVGMCNGGGEEQRADPSLNTCEGRRIALVIDDGTPAAAAISTAAALELAGANVRFICPTRASSRGTVSLAPAPALLGTYIASCDDFYNTTQVASFHAVVVVGGIGVLQQIVDADLVAVLQYSGRYAVYGAATALLTVSLQHPIATAVPTAPLVWQRLNAAGIPIALNDSALLDFDEGYGNGHRVKVMGGHTTLTPNPASLAAFQAVLLESMYVAVAIPPPRDVVAASLVFGMSAAAIAGVAGLLCWRRYKRQRRVESLLAHPSSTIFAEGSIS